jgi:type I restriction enzyme M protein
VILHREDPNVFTQISSIPTIGQTLEDVIREPWTLERLAAENRLVRERLSLKRIILDLEDLVLGNAGVDAFDEVFKLLYAKLYDEWAAANLPARSRSLQFRRYGESPGDLKVKIDGLFSEAKRRWPDVFAASDRIELTPSHLLTCVTFLQDIKLFNANLDVIDEAFEYLVTQVAKGSKGKYFTPRWSFDMSIKMIIPQSD